THPLHWSADRDEVQDFEYTIRSRLMQGAGLLRGPMKPKQPFQPTELDEHLAGRSKDLDALAIYCNSFEFTLSPHIPAPGKLSPAAERGKGLFFSKEVGCAACHSEIGRASCRERVERWVGGGARKKGLLMGSGQWCRQLS